MRFPYMHLYLCIALFGINSLTACRILVEGDDIAIAHCGDGLVNAAAGEVCDDGNNTDGDGCSADCLSGETCGNGYCDVSEECDTGGNSATCDADCTIAVCGDNTVNNAAGEMCDSGGVDTASCDRDCTLVACGDGQANSAAGEACDDGNSNDRDDCLSSCALARCGDGQLWDEGNGAEECDDGNGDNGDGCLNTCVVAICGDGVVQVGVEECDDSNGDDTDWCTTECELATCDDGLQNAGELDVDCGALCGPGSCQDGQNCLNDSDCEMGACTAGQCRTVTMLVLGGSHTCALLATGTLRCWGRNTQGQLGYGHTDDIGDDELPNTAGDVDLGGTPVQLTAGDQHTCALLATGAVRCWGYNNVGQLGYGHTNNIGDNELPSTAGDVALGGTAIQISAGRSHMCALLSTGAIRCWGQNTQGQLGYGYMNHIGDDELPSAAGDVALGGTAVQVAASGHHTCALLSTGAVRCWGHNPVGELGYGHTNHIGDDELPSTAGDVALGGTTVQLAVGGVHNCALLATDNVRCWGNNERGKLGYGHTNHIGDNELPNTAGDVALGGTPVQFALGNEHSCVLLSTGTVRCWGYNFHGQLGYGHTSNIGDDELPDTAGDVALGGTPVQVVSGRYHVCAQLSTGALRCWGQNTYGQLGYGHTSDIGDDELPSSAGDVPFL